MGNAPGEATSLLRRIKIGDQEVMVEPIPLVYQELRRLGGRIRRDDGASDTGEPG